MREHTAVIVGGSSGIGLATARELAAAGTNVHIAGRAQDKLDHLLSADPALQGHRADGGERK